MPKITINEIDMTSGGAFLATNNVVYIPGFTSLETEDAKKISGIPTLFKSVEDFQDVIGDTPKTFGTAPTKVDDKSYIMAYELLRLGLHVLYEVPNTTLAGDTPVDTEAEMKTALKQAGFWTRLTDRGNYDIRFMTAGAYLESEDNTATTIKAMTTACGVAGRGDAIALIDHAPDADGKSAVLSYYTGLKSLIDGRFAAGFTPWVHMSSEAFTADNSSTLMPASFGYLSAFARSVQTNSSWQAVAGAVRGRIPGLIAPYVSIKYGEHNIDDLQSREADAVTVNPIVNIAPYGHIVWGNRTLQPVGKTDKSVETDLVASNFLNIRHLVSSIKKALFIASRGQTFEQNSDVLWINFKAAITPLLDRMKSGNGIADYRLIKKKSSKKATLTAIIRIVPIEAVEDFDLTVELSDSIEVVGE